MLAIINYGLGNLTSIRNMCKRIGVEAEITADPGLIESADLLVLPGVGHFKKGMENLHDSGLRQLLDRLVLGEKKPILGICLGAQLMTGHSEEGDTTGLGWVDADTIRFRDAGLNGLKVPHMGWREITLAGENPLWADLPPEPRFYFVHSYHFRFRQPSEVTGTALYGYEFACAFRKGNIYGTQFHPEKSHKFGMKVLENFAGL
ncbi:MAG TPA: imidazole glycerol phosphate synthase subunit HisH [Puia sp.]|jgi:glutamine amidotransferase|nr:imidazole glycerol phosphate synthase subunit HisH [Puia sp.]